MKNSESTNSQGSPNSATPQRLSPWQRLKGKNISYLTLPLIVMATVVEFVILATGWKYQQKVCLPQGMGVTFFGIGPIGATILAVELLKLPLAIWTASRTGWAKGFMMMVGLPLICVLTFQLVKDMAVYEMGAAMTPPSEFLEKAAAEEIKIVQLNGELAAIEEKKADRDHKRTELAAKQAKSKADLEESLKRNGDTRQDAITLTDYQKKELSEVEARQATIIKQFDADTAQLTKSISDLRARRETELAGATKWNAEEARIENAYKTKMSDYSNKKAAYEKGKEEYANANVLKRQFLKEPVSPGVPPEREVNTILKPTLIAELDEQIKAKETELASVNVKRRDRVAQVDADARRVREEFDRRSGTKREETDRKREEMLAAHAALTAELKAEEKQVDTELAAAVKKVDGIRADIDASRKKADGYYEAREEAIKNTQVHRIATTVEIVRGLFMGERPVSIKATAKERGDLYTDQISMVRVWVYPVLAFLVAFLPTLMVEVGFSTLFKPEQQRPQHRLGFMGRRLHEVSMRAGRVKILRAERMAREVSTEIASRDKALAAANANAEKALAAKEDELQAIREANAATAAKYEQQLKSKEDRHEQELEQKEDAWVAKFTGVADSLNRAIIEKDALRDLQKSEIERQIQMRQHAWSDRLTQLRQELDDQRTASEAERTTLMQEQHEKLMAVSEECKTQVIQVRRQMAEAELAAVEASAKLAHDLKEALHARDTAESELRHQADTFALTLSQAKEDAARDVEKAVRQEELRLERQQLEFGKTLRRREEDFEHELKKQEQELSIGFDARAVEIQTKLEQDGRRRETEIERQFEARALEVDARWKQDVQQREEAAQIKLKQREQQLQAQTEARLSDLQTQAEQELRRRESELERQLEAQTREADARLKEELQQKEMAHQTKLKQYEQESAIRSAARETELQSQFAADLRVRAEEWERQAEQELRRRESELERQLETQTREADTRLKEELQQKEMAHQAKLKQHEQELAIQAAARETELQNQFAAGLRVREEEWERQTESRVRATEARLGHETHQKEEFFQVKLRQREQQLQSQFDANLAELRAQWDQELHGHEQEWTRNTEASARAIESRWKAEMKQKEEQSQFQLRQRDQQWQAKLDTAQNELQTQNDQVLRRREAEAAEAGLRAQRELEARLRQEMQQKEEAAQAKAKQREQDLVAQMNAQAEAHQTAKRELEIELETTRSTIEPLETMLASTRDERDEARQSFAGAARQAQDLEKKLTEASSFLNGWKNGKHLAAAGR